jgi:hypothetical protein
MRLFTLTAADVRFPNGVMAGAIHINLECITHLTDYQYVPTQAYPNGRRFCQVSLGDTAYSFELTESAFNRSKAAITNE